MRLECCSPSPSLTPWLSRHLVVLATALLLSGCAATFRSSHTERFGEVLPTLPDSTETLSLATSILEDIPDEKTAFLLYEQESARLTQVAGDPETSRAQFAVALDAYKQQASEALVTADEAASQALSIYNNDRAIPYEGASFERVFAHHFQSINYLLLNDRQGALIEMRAAATQQRFSTQDFAKQVAKAEDDQSELHQLLGESGGVALGTLSGDGRNRFENAYTYAYSGVLREMTGDDNGAFIDYRKALTLQPNNGALRQLAARLAPRYAPGEADDFRAGVPAGRSLEIPADKARVVVFVERGWVQPRKEVKVTVHDEEGGLLSIALPTYDTTTRRNQLPTFSIERQPIQPLMETLPMAKWDLRQRYLAIVARQTARFIAKNDLNDRSRANLNQQDDLLSALLYIATNVYNHASERADTRTWLSLPARVEMGVYDLDPDLTGITFASGNRASQIDVTLTPGKRTLIRIIDTGTFFQSDVLLSE